MDTIIGLGLLVIFLFIYFLPAYIANKKKKKNTGAIFVLNLFLGWTFIGWIIALVWAVAYEEKDNK